MDILQAIGRGFFFLDGGMGTLLQERGLRAGELPERWNLAHADEIVRIHSEYLAAGADAITTNTFGANALKYSDEELRAVIDGALSCARKATDQAGRGYILFDIGPSGKLLRPYGDLDFEDAVELFAKTVRLIGDRADAILIETMNDSYETKAAVLAAKENSSLPVFVTNVYGADGKLMTGADIPAMVALLEGLGVDALGMNCSLGSAQMARLLPQMYAESSVPVIVQPNAGLPREENGKTVYDEDEAFFAENLLSCAKDGARMLGGCCGTTPAYIRRAADTIKGTEPLPVVERATSVASSYTHAVGLGKVPVLIGERINPTGKKLLKQALRDHDVGYILNEALAQEKAGAHILDVNVGLPELDEAETLVRVMCALQEVTALPLQLDSSSPEALARAMRRYNGKPMVNSVNGKKSSMREIFPLVKKYGGLVVALTLDETGIPATAEGRLKIARKILRAAERYGIKRKDIVFDPLAMAVSADPSAPRATLGALSLLREKLGANTVLGVSNVSFGLPNRELITSAFFALALDRGLSAAIMNPFSAEMIKTYRSFLALTGADENCSEYISFAAGLAPAASVTAAPAKAESVLSEGLRGAIVRGLKDQAAACAKELLRSAGALEIIDREIVPALDEVGKGFEEKRVFLPQLLMSAEAAKAAFAEIRGALSGAGEEQPRKCAVVLATVEGDIHDIGKNIVKALLENYSFRVIDLGRDVPPEKIVQAAEESGAPVVGLSALMTTTVPAMERTIALLRERLPACKVIVGGAVLTEDYANKIGADAYGKDAMASVRYCEEIDRLSKRG